MVIYDILWPKKGKDKTKWQIVGILIDKDGKMSIKLDMIPADKDWDGWLIVKKRNEDEEVF